MSVSGLYIPTHFKAVELVPKAIYNKHKSRGDNWFWQTVFDERLLIVIDTIRTAFGPMTINDWSWAGTSQYRGFRPPNCGVGATLSQHRFGRAADLIAKDIHPDLIRDEIIDHQNEEIWGLVGGLEMNISWLHVDVRQRGKDGKISLFYP
jgi:hypothetical protein